MNEPRNDPYWWGLKDQVKLRAGGLCEYCRRRVHDELHHRTYIREFHEDICDVMLVCRACHKAIHFGVGKNGIVVSKGSLADLGDTGHGIDGDAWKSYLGVSP